MPKLPPAPDHTARYWRNISEHRLEFPRCRQCAHAWLPVSHECSRCFSTDWDFEQASGAATLLSWVVYHHSYDQQWAGRIPYVVGLIELKEGPRLMSNVIGVTDFSCLEADQPLHLVFEDEQGTTVPRFAPNERVCA